MKCETQKKQTVEVDRDCYGMIVRCCVSCRDFDKDKVYNYSCGGLKCDQISCQECLGWTSPGCFKPDPQTS